jgi:hypothetical protein
MSHPSEGVIWFAGRMLRKFLVNGHKRGWDDIELSYGLERLEMETDELRPLVERGPQLTPAELEELIDECADIANFALMLAWRAAKWKGGVKDLPPPQIFRTGPS